MFRDYTDITDRIKEKPKWWDEHGVPRYAEFGPYQVANIYAVETVLLEIACHLCLRQFHVAMSGQGGAGQHEEGRSLADRIRKGDIGYGDPPNYGNCRDGASSGTFCLRVLQYWARPKGWGSWERDSSLEIVLPEMQDYKKDMRNPES